MTRPRTLRAHLIRAAERAGLAWSALVLVALVLCGRREVSGASERMRQWRF